MSIFFENFHIAFTCTSSLYQPSGNRGYSLFGLNLHPTFSMWFVQGSSRVWADTPGSKPKPALSFPAWAGRTKEPGLCPYPKKLRTVLEGNGYIAYFFLVHAAWQSSYNIVCCINEWVKCISNTHDMNSSHAAISLRALSPWTVGNQHLRQSLLEHRLLPIIWAPGSCQR